MGHGCDRLKLEVVYPGYNSAVFNKLVMNKYLLSPRYVYIKLLDSVWGRHCRPARKISA